MPQRRIDVTCYAGGGKRWKRADGTRLELLRGQRRDRYVLCVPLTCSKPRRGPVADSEVESEYGLIISRPMERRWSGSVVSPRMLSLRHNVFLAQKHFP